MFRLLREVRAVMTIRGWLRVVFFLAWAAGCADERRSAAPSAPVATGPAGPTRRHAALEVRATFHLVVPSTTRAARCAREVSAFAESHEGYVQSSTIGHEDATELVLRVPPAQLGALRSMLTRMADDGAVREEVTSTDVTEALADLDARLRAQRAAEARLLALLEQRTGTLADVLAVEHALADVRAQIEQLEAEQRTAQGRVDLATVTVDLRQWSGVADGALGPKISEAFHDGVRAARATSVGALLLALRLLPTLLLLGSPVALFLLVRRWRARAARRDAPPT